MTHKDNYLRRATILKEFGKQIFSWQKTRRSGDICALENFPREVGQNVLQWIATKPFIL